MVVSAEKVAEKLSHLARGHGQHPEAEIDDVNGTSMFEMPAPADWGGQRHLSGCRNQILLNRFHFPNHTWYGARVYQTSLNACSGAF
jgi:hypothetical protein